MVVESKTLYQVMKFEINRTLAWGFMVIWLGMELCLMFVVVTGDRSFKFLECHRSYLLSRFWASPSILPQSASCSSFSYNLLLLYWGPVGVVLMEGKGSIIIWWNLSVLVAWILGLSPSQVFLEWYNFTHMLLTPFLAYSICYWFPWSPDPCCVAPLLQPPHFLRGQTGRLEVLEMEERPSPTGIRLWQNLFPGE